MRVHEDPALFGASINYTMASTGFLPGLIEKDYFCFSCPASRHRPALSSWIPFPINR
jgi:hypothetical protein